MAQVEETGIGFLGHGAVDPGETVLVDFGRQLAGLLDLGDGAEFQTGKLAGALAQAGGKVVAVND